MQLFVKTLDQSYFTIEADYNDTVLDFKKRIFDMTGIYIEHQKLIFAGKEIMDHRTLVQYSISKEATIYMVLRFPGA